MDLQPFAVTVCEDTGRVVVTCCTPVATPLFRSSNKLIIFNAANFAHVQTISMTDSYDVPRCAISVGRNFAVCHGWVMKPGKVRIEPLFHDLLLSCKLGGVVQR